MPGELPCRAEGLLSHAFAVGAEIFGFTTAYLRGLGFFSPLDFTIHPNDYCGSTTRRSGIRLGHRLSPQPLARFVHHPYGGKVLSASHVFRLYLMDGVFLRGSLRLHRWTVSLGSTQGPPPALLFLVYQREAGFLQAISLRRVSFHRRKGLTASPRLPVYGPGGESWEGLRRSSLCPCRGYSSFKVFRISLSF
jgi:hypothetical protein